MPGEEHFHAVVIGSGFGGSVVAQRLAEETNRRVLVLERGQPHPPGTFTRSPYGMRSSFWAPGTGRYGMFESWSFDGLDAVVSSGLGGGSLIYANVMLRKPASTFVRDEDQGSSGYETWPVSYAELKSHYDAVEALFESPERYPFDRAPYSATPKTQAMMEMGAKIGVAELPKLAVRFSANGGDPAPGQPIPGGEKNFYGVARSTCRLCGECDVGCNYGAKSTLDFTCLWKASQAGAQIRTCCEVRTIEPAPGRKGYLVGYTQHTAARDGHPRELLDPHERRSGGTVHADQVILSAGAIGSPRLLLENRVSLRRLSPALGARVSANGDYFAWVRECRRPDGDWRYLEPSLGPVITTAIHVDDEHAAGGRGYYIEDAGAPAFADWLWQETEVAGDLLRARTLFIRDLISRLRGRRVASRSAVLAALLGDASASAAMMPVLAMGRDVPCGQMSIGDGGLRLDWSEKPSERYYADVRHSLERLAAKLGGQLVKTPLDWQHRAITVHPVGGCGMSEDPNHGVVDSFGRVHGYPGLWVADGSVMPGPVGTNPSLTIAALAHRFADEMIEQAKK